MQNSDIIIIATKPDAVKNLLTSLAKDIPHEEFSKKSFISIAAGIPLSALQSYLPSETKSIIRVMPNTPCLVGQCATAYAAAERSSAQDKANCASIFGAVGTVNEVPEYLMDAVTGLSGSGPACNYHLIMTE